MLIALLLAVGFYSLVRLSGQSAEPISAAAEPAEAELIGIQPPSFQQISEFSEDGVQKLKLSGVGEAGAVIILTNRGERLRQIRVDDLGQWGVTLQVEESAMAIESQLYKNEEAIAVRSEETIFRIPAPDMPSPEDRPSPENSNSEGAGAQSPDSEEPLQETDVNKALIMVTSPGRPSRIVQSPFGGFPSSGPLSLSVIDYDYAGGVTITGTSSVPGRVRVYADNAVIGDITIGVSGRWSYIAPRMLPRREVDIRVELIAAQGIPNAPDRPATFSVPYNFLPPLREDQTDGSGALLVSFEPFQWQVRRTLIGGGGQSTVIFSPKITEEFLKADPAQIDPDQADPPEVVSVPE